MITCITSVIYDYQFLPHYLEYYRGLGVERFVIVVDPFLGQRGNELRNVTKDQNDIILIPPSERFRQTKIYGAIHDEARRQVAEEGDWIIPADLDEYNQYSSPLKELIEKMEEGNYTHYSGHMSDRIAADGTLSPIRHDISLWDQYPLEADITKNLVGALTNKVMLARGNVALWLGHHFAEGQNLKPFPHEGNVHHFKWRAGVLEMLKTRIQIEKKASVPWVNESERTLAYFTEQGKFDLTAIATRKGFKPTP